MRSSRAAGPSSCSSCVTRQSWWPTSTRRTADPMALDRDRARLLELLTQLSFEKRRVTLSSGKESDFYIDCKRTVLTAEGHFLVGRLLWRDIQRLAPGAAAVAG